MKYLCIALLLPANVLLTVAQSVKLSDLTKNNTAACSAGKPYCSAAFAGMSDAASGTYNPTPHNVSTRDNSTLLYAGNTTNLYLMFEAWFCMNAGSSATGVGTNCNSHVQVGYNSNDAATVNAQMNDIMARGFNGVIVDWSGKPYGTVTTGCSDGAQFCLENETTKKVQANLWPRCSGPQSCLLLWAISEDQRAFQYFCAANAYQPSCIQNKIDSDLDYANLNFFGNNAYLKVSPVALLPAVGGRPVVLFYIDEAAAGVDLKQCTLSWPCHTAGGTTCPTAAQSCWQMIWDGIRSHTSTFSNGAPWLVFRNPDGFSHEQSNGSFAWVNILADQPDSWNAGYLDTFYSTSLSFVITETVWGGAYKGFDNTNAPWIGGSANASVMRQHCGEVWRSSMAAESRNSYYSASRQLPFLLVGTWNDYDEGTEIETGIDNCRSVTASVSGSVLSWSAPIRNVQPFASTYSKESSFAAYEIYWSTDGTNVKRLTTKSTSTHSLDLSAYALPAGTIYLWVRGVGKASILNRLSGRVTYIKP